MNTIQQIAERFGVHPVTVSRWMNRKKNRLESVRIGNRCVRITDEQLAKFIVRNSVTGERK